MVNPEVTVVTVTDTRSLVFAGCGKLRLAIITANAALIGDAGVTYGSLSNLIVTLNTPSIPYDVDFEANAELYAVCPPGQTTSLRIVRWF